MLLAFVVMAGAGFAQAQKTVILNKQNQSKLSPIKKDAPATTTKLLCNWDETAIIFDYKANNGDYRFGPQPTAQKTILAGEWFRLPHQACQMDSIAFVYCYLKPDAEETDSVTFFFWNGIGYEEDNYFFLEFSIAVSDIAANAKDSVYMLRIADELGAPLEFTAETETICFGYYTENIAFYTALMPSTYEAPTASTATLYGDMSKMNEYQEAKANTWIEKPYHAQNGDYYDISLYTMAFVSGVFTPNILMGFLQIDGSILLDVQSFDFHEIAIGRPETVLLYLYNYGAAPGAINSVQITSGSTAFSVEDTAAILQDERYIALELTFTPTEEGLAEATLTLSTPEGEKTMALSGTGVASDGITTAKAANIAIYPNPAKDMLNISNAENAQISIYNLMGQEVRRVEKATALEVINVADLARGSYIVKIMNEGNVATQKFNVVR